MEFNVGLCEDRKAEVLCLRESSTVLRQRCRVEKIQLYPKMLEKPRMVCTASSCVDYQDDGSGNVSVTTVYKAICHDGCYLTNLPADVIASPEFLKCEIFDISGRCTRCNHSWQQHQHILYELKEKVVTVIDYEMRAQLTLCEENICSLKAAVELSERLHTEYHTEKGEVERAVLRLAALFKQNSIIPYNDTTLKYLDEVLIPKADGDTSKLALQESRQNHEKFVETIQHSLKLVPAELLRDILSEKEINKQLEHLYMMKHFGRTLKEDCAGIKAMYVGQAREESPYKVQI